MRWPSLSVFLMSVFLVRPLFRLNLLSFSYAWLVGFAPDELYATIYVDGHNQLLEHDGTGWHDSDLAPNRHKTTFSGQKE